MRTVVPSEPPETPPGSELGSAHSVPSAVHSTPGGSSSVQFINVQPNLDDEIEQVAAGYISIAAFNGPLTTGTPGYGEKSLLALIEAYVTVYNLPTTKALPPPTDLDDTLKARVMSLITLSTWRR